MFLEHEVMLQTFNVETDLDKPESRVLLETKVQKTLQRVDQSFPPVKMRFN